MRSLPFCLLSRSFLTLPSLLSLVGNACLGELAFEPAAAAISLGELFLRSNFVCFFFAELFVAEQPESTLSSQSTFSS